MRLRFALAVAALCALPAACKKPTGDKPDPATTPKPAELPALEVRPDTPNLLLTWIDDKGDFIVAQKPTEVPPEGRGKVRVVVSTRDEGTGQLIYVTNLDESTATGSYRLKTITRSEWEELGASKRKARLEALAPSATPSGQPPLAGGNGPGGPGAAQGAKAPVKGVVAIIYGADWCKPCHEAERYLKQRGVAVTKKNIDDNEVAAEEMQKKLARVGRGGSSIPVIDIMGQILIGFSPAALEQALEQAQHAKGL